MTAKRNPHEHGIANLRAGGEQAGIIRHVQAAIGHLLLANLRKAKAEIEWMDADKLRQVALVADALAWTAHDLVRIREAEEDGV